MHVPDYTSRISGTAQVLFLITLNRPKDMNKITIDQDQFDSLLTDLAELTETNCHGEALEKVAEFFKDQQLVKAFEAINVLHNTVGYLDSPIAELRQQFTSILWERIEHHYGEGVTAAVYNCL